MLVNQAQPAQIYDPGTGMFELTGSAINSTHSAATLLQNGKVLLTGGSHPELYDPATGAFSFTSSNLTTAHLQHSSSLLTDGSVLIAGGNTLNAEIYIPANDAFVPTRAMTRPRTDHTATALATEEF